MAADQRTTAGYRLPITSSARHGIRQHLTASRGFPTDITRPKAEAVRRQAERFEDLTGTPGGHCGHPVTRDTVPTIQRRTVAVANRHKK